MNVSRLAKRSSLPQIVLSCCHVMLKLYLSQWSTAQGLMNLGFPSAFPESIWSTRTCRKHTCVCIYILWYGKIYMHITVNITHINTCRLYVYIYTHISYIIHHTSYIIYHISYIKYVYVYVDVYVYVYVYVCVYIYICICICICICTCKKHRIIPT